MSKNKERMSYLGTLAHLNETLRKNYTKNDIPEKEIKRAYAKDMNELFCQENNGANMSIDQTLRTFLIEYNSRLQKHGFFSFPSSFNVLEAFFKYTRFSKFILREEKDHMLFLEDFMDFITQPTTKINPDEIFNTIEDNLIHNYTMRDIPGTFSFFASKNQYVIQGVSLVKHEDEINILAILGKKADIDKETEKIIKAQTEHGKRFRDVEPDPLLKLEAVRLSPDTNYWKHLVATRYNLKTKTYDVRYVMADCGNSYIIVTDDQNIFVNLPAEKREETLKESITKLQKYLDLFEIIQTFLYLPFYFLEHDESSKIEKHPTNLRTKIWNIPHHEQQKLKPLFKTFSRSVHVLDRKKDIYPTSNQYPVTPHFKLEREGFWKTLEPHKTGTDRDGMPIQGRTWVTKTLYWEESTLDTINTKRTSTDEDKISSYQTSGSIYIMISASDKENIYKVGKTTRDPIKRASEISSGTGVPTKYLVVKKWLVADCHIAEKIIHEHLKEYRINDNREFFKIEYDILSEIVDNVVKDINTSVLNTDTQ